MEMDNRFSGLPGAPASTSKTRWFQFVAIEKPLKRLSNRDDLLTGLKPGENGMKTFGPKQRS